MSGHRPECVCAACWEIPPARPRDPARDEVRRWLGAAALMAFTWAVLDLLVNGTAAAAVSWVLP